MSPLWLALATPAYAHEPGLSTLVVTDEGMSWTLSATDAAGIDDPGALAATTTLSVAGQPCQAGQTTVAADEDGFVVQVPMDCPGGASWTVDTPWLSALPPGHRLYVEAFEAPVAVLSAARHDVAFDHETSGHTSVGVEFGMLGMEHIVTGYDHLAFLFALLLVARSFKEMAGIVSGFTLAHSITLSAAVLGWVSIPGWIVEPAIALSIVAVGLENFFQPSPRRRFAVTMSLGLVHGFGFAGMLSEVGLPEGSQLLALLAFNGGVELGQLALVALVLPALLRMRKAKRFTTWGVRLCSLLLIGLGQWWFLERAVF